MDALFLILTISVLALMVPFMGRIIIGPTVYDRVLGLNAIGSLTPLVLVLVGLVYERVDMFVDVALALLLLNLFTTLMVARYARPAEGPR